MALSNPQSADHIAAEAGAFEPQRKNNFAIEIPLPNADKDLVLVALQGFSLPKQGNDVVELQYQNEKRKVAGQVSVDESTLTLKDYVDVDTRGAILRWRKQVYDPQTGKVGLAKNYKKTVHVVMTAPDGTSQRVAKLVGAWPSADPTIDLAMDGGDAVMMECPIAIDKIDWSISIQGA